MKNHGRFGPLLGAIHIGSTHTRFLVYAAQNAEVLTLHEVELKPICSQSEWMEFDPVELWKSVVECIEETAKTLEFLTIDIRDIDAVGITNQRETTVLWNKTTGQPIYNAIAWNDTRTTEIVNRYLARVHNKKNYLKSVCGLPFSNCFSAVKVNWLIENVSAVNVAIDDGECLFGTLDSWIIWNLTQGEHKTDVTNASRTMLMNLESLDWDCRLCNFFKIPKCILPQIVSCSEIFGYIQGGPLASVPIAGCLGDQQASLLGQLCVKVGQCTNTYDDGGFFLVNTGQEIIDSDNGLLTTVAFQLGPSAKPYYALEGATCSAGSALTWLRENMQIDTELNQNSINLTGADNFSIAAWREGSPIARIDVNKPNRTKVVFVPALSGYFSPNWKHDARGAILGIDKTTKTSEVTLAAFEAICYQTRDILEAVSKDLKTWPTIEKLTVGGEMTEKSFLLELLADITGIKIERPQTSSPACLGAMIAAGLTIGVLTIDSYLGVCSPPADLFTPSITEHQRDAKYKRWKYAVDKCLRWDNCNDEEEFERFSYKPPDPDAFVQASIPGGLYVVSSFVLLLIADIFKDKILT